MILALTFAIAMAQTPPAPVVQTRPNSEDIYCAAIAVHLSENVVAHDQTDAITGMAAMGAGSLTIEGLQSGPDGQEAGWIRSVSSGIGSREL